MAFLIEMSKRCYVDFIPREWDKAKVYVFSPNVKMLDRICMRYTKVRPVKAYSGNFYKATENMVKMKYLFVFSLLKAIQAIIKTRSIVGGFYVKQTYFMNEINKNLTKPEEKRDYIGTGGSNQLVNLFLDFMKKNNIEYNMNNSFDVVVGGGGWDGHKAQMKYAPINKIEFVSNIVKLFGTSEKRIVDIYGFTECPVAFGSHWSNKYEDFIFHCPPYSKIIIRDIDTLEPLRNKGDRGLLEVLTPFGNEASIRHAIMVDDNVELISENNCPECNYQGATFRILGRIDKKDGLGCSSLIEWI